MPLPDWARDRDPQQYSSKEPTSVSPQYREKCVYTGTYVTGIALLPKQNYTTITDPEQGRTDPKRR